MLVVWLFSFCDNFCRLPLSCNCHSKSYINSFNISASPLIRTSAKCLKFKSISFMVPDCTNATIIYFSDLNIQRQAMFLSSSNEPFMRQKGCRHVHRGFNWISLALDRKVVGATRAFDSTCWQNIWAATTGSETQFCTRFLLLDQETGWRVQQL